MEINLPLPELQIDFSKSLKSIRQEYLQDALLSTVRESSLHEIDAQLQEYVKETDLKNLAAHGLRGELLFPVPYLLCRNPRLIGYYRLLLGFSQKEFYGRGVCPGFFKKMENGAPISDRQKSQLAELCISMVRCSSMLLSALDDEDIKRDFLDDLTLLTLGPQLRGGANVRKGTTGIQIVFSTIKEIVQAGISEEEPNRIVISNAAGRSVVVKLAADPDIVIQEEMEPGVFRNIIAIEVKSGTDFSNIHNRIGEAEKSHQKARQAGFVECWTIVNVDLPDWEMAEQESPSTNRFYRISDLTKGDGEAFLDFRSRVISLVGIPG